MGTQQELTRRVRQGHSEDSANGQRTARRLRRGEHKSNNQEGPISYAATLGPVAASNAYYITA